MITPFWLSTDIIHTHIHTYTYIHIHTYIHTYIHIHTYTLIHTNLHTLRQTYIWKTSTDISANIHMYVDEYYIQFYIDTYLHSYTRTHAHWKYVHNNLLHRQWQTYISSESKVIEFYANLDMHHSTSNSAFSLRKLWLHKI